MRFLAPTSERILLPGRFRRRLTAAFVLTATVGAGLVAVLAIVIAHEYPSRNFRERSRDEARVALALAPPDLNAEGFQRLLAQYEARSDAGIVALGDAGGFASSTALRLDDVPHELRSVRGDELDTAEADVAGRPYLIVAARTDSGDRYWLFFSLRELQESLDLLTRATLAALGLAVVLAGGTGWYLARTTLRPVAAAAGAAEAIRAGRRDARLPEGPDEFGAWAASFNRMADTVAETIDKLEHAAERERRFTADVAHELRTPLTAMAASAAILDDLIPTLPAEARRPVQLLTADVRRLRRLVLDLLELSRLDATAMPISPEPLDLRETVAAAARGLGASAPADIHVDIEPDLHVLAEPARIDRILGNVLANATEHGAGPVLVKAHREDNDKAVVEITDHGPGIPADELPHVFDRFAKTDRSRTTSGSGLGLAIAQAQAEALGGSLTARNTPEAGACLTLRLLATDTPLG
jgi:two-component system sensor histidine kinase MtrB